MLSRENLPTLLALRRGEVVRGESYDVGGRKLTPIARVKSFRRAGGRFEFLAVDPVGLVEEAGGSRRLIAIGGGQGTRAAMLVLVSLPVVAYVVASVIVRATRRSRPGWRRRFGRR
jgi:hypothetical protein